jgi:fengycin family lipopeptide synthetase D/gramicidin S synthase 1/tyrocidine synthetase-1/tyrocidine synthetase-2
VPNDGIGYGLLKYLPDATHRQDIDFGRVPLIDFRYYLQAFQKAEKSAFSSIGEPENGLRSVGNERISSLALSCRIVENRLLMTLSFSRQQFRKETVALLLENLTSCLRQILDYCTRQDVSESTPTDFTYKELSIENLENLFD